jgi:Ca2+-binding RTX toxin-like protein
LDFLLLLALPVLALLFGGMGDDAESEGEKQVGGTEDDDLVGGAGADEISGLAGRDSLSGAAGDDTVYGGHGADFVDGGAGDDLAVGGSGNDFVLGFTGDDTLEGGVGYDIVLGEEGNDLIKLGWGNDTNWVDDDVSAYGFEHGQLGDDSVYGGAGNDSIWDYAGTNVLDGGDGDDVVAASDNQLPGWQTAAMTADVLTGGAGHDTLVGDDGDTLSGGTGHDRFVVDIRLADDKPAIVTDFDGNLDLLDLAVDETLADPLDWRFFFTTDAASGDVSLGLVNKIDVLKIIDLVVLQKPINFDASKVLLQPV